MPRVRPAPSLARARLALYGTIGICSLVSFETYGARSVLRRAAIKDDENGWRVGMKHWNRLQKYCVCSKRNIEEGRYYTLISSAWNHDSGIHFFGNMIGLWSFGRVIAYTFGAGTFMTVFYGGALVGNLLCLGLDGRFESESQKERKALERSNIPPAFRAGADQQRGAGFVGASGGVCAIMAANACLNPWGQMVIGIMFIPVPLPNIIGALGFAGFSAWAQTNNFQANVAHLGHLGGLIYGFVWFVTKFRGLPLIY